MKIPFLILGFTGPIGAGCTTLAGNIARINPTNILKRNKLYEKTISDLACISKEMNKLTNEKDLEVLNKRFRILLQQRTYLRIVNEIDQPKFKYISMSVIILKLVLESMDVQEFDEWSKKSKILSRKFKEFKLKWIETLNLYNTSSEKDFDKLSEEQLNNIDKLFEDLEELRTNITKIELGDFFRHKIDELYLVAFGNNLRLTGNAFISDETKRDSEKLTLVAREVNRYIKYYRNRSDSNNVNCFIVDAFRNPAEVEFFRRYDQFFLISLFASEDIRKNRFANEIYGVSSYDRVGFSEDFKKISERDWGDDSKIKDLHKQNVSRCCFIADIAINNEETNSEFDLNLFNKFLRYYALIASPGCVQPTKDEMFMNLAYSLSLRSSCISRKVGAVVTDNEGFVLGVGWNDVAHGQIGCGLRQKEDFLKETELFSMEIFKKILSKEDFEQYSDYDSICFKDAFSQHKIKEKLAKSNLKQKDREEVLRVLNIKRLEFCRSLHAEENALLQVAARGGMGVNGGEIYTTTFPCELCAKKLYQSGIKRIYYTEPYPNSISENVFLKDGIRRIELKQFEGVKSFSYFKLFKPLYDKKEAQKIDDLE